MAVCAGAAEPGAPVLDVHPLVALVALKNGLLDRLVGIVTGFTRERCVRREPRIRLGLERPVAARAMPPTKHIRLRLENMACVAVHRHAIEIDMRERSLLLVALGADSGIGRVEGGYARVVAFVALHVLVDHVSGMSG